MLEFSSKQAIEMRSGDWITGSFNSKGKLKYLINHKIRKYWDVQQGMGCIIAAAILISISVAFVTILVLLTISLLN